MKKRRRPLPRVLPRCWNVLRTNEGVPIDCEGRMEPVYSYGDDQLGWICKLCHRFVYGDCRDDKPAAQSGAEAEGRDATGEATNGDV